MGETHVVRALTFEQSMALRAFTEKNLRQAENALREVDAITVKAVRELAYEGNEISPYWEGRAISGLYHLALFFRLEKEPFVR
jgi:hypothetical protein